MSTVMCSQCGFPSRHMSAGRVRARMDAGGRPYTCMACRKPKPVRCDTCNKVNPNKSKARRADGKWTCRPCWVATRSTVTYSGPDIALTGGRWVRRGLTLVWVPDEQVSA